MSGLNLSELLDFLTVLRLEIAVEASSTRAIDRERAEEAIQLAYRLMDQAKPTVVWLENPFQLAHAPAIFRGFCTEQLYIARLDNAVGKSVRTKIESLLGPDDFD